MSDDDLIRRGDALAVIMKAQTASCTCLTKTNDPSWHMDGCKYRILRDVEAMIDHVPPVTILAAEVSVKPLRYVDPEGETLDQMREHARQHPLARKGDMKLVWINEGDLYNHSISALTAQPSPDVAALVDDAGLLLDAYKAVLVLHRVMEKHGLTAGASAAENIADRIVAAHPEFPGLSALRGAAIARVKGGA